MKIRAIVAVTTSLIDEAVIISIIVWALPRLGIHIPLVLSIAIVVLFAGFCVTTYIYGTKILNKQPVIGFTDMTGMKGYTDTVLMPEGLVKIKGEIWEAITDNGNIAKGVDIIVIDQRGLKLVVRKIDNN